MNKAWSLGNLSGFSRILIYTLTNVYHLAISDVIWSTNFIPGTNLQHRTLIGVSKDPGYGDLDRLGK